MANKIILKRSSVPNKAPVAGDVEYGELALNYNDGKLFYKKVDNTIESFEAGLQTINLTGAVTGSGTGDITTSLSATGATAGSYTNANITVGADGRITSVANGSPSGLPDQTGNSGKFLTTDGSLLSWGTIDLSNYQPVDADLTAIGGLTGTSGILTKTAADTWTLDTNTYLTTTLAASNYQAKDDDLTAISALSGTTGILKKTALNTWALDTTSYQPQDNDLTAIAGLAGTSGLLKKTAADTWTLDTSTYLTGITSGQVTTALGYTPYNSTNPNGYTTNTGTVTSVGGTGTVNGLTLTGTVTSAGNLTLGGTLAVTVSNLYNGTNASASTYLRGDGTWATVSASDATKLPLAGGTMSGNISWTTAGTNYIGNGNADGASYANYNLRIRSWYGIGFPSYDDVNRIVFDTRNGNISTLGTITAAGFSGNATSASTAAKLDSSVRCYSREWLEMPNYSGLYSPNNNAHFHPNDLSYGSWRLRGSRNGWGGIEFSDATTTLMMNDNTYGFHRNGVGWKFYCESGSGYFPGNVVAGWSDSRLKDNQKRVNREDIFTTLAGLRAYRFNWNSKAVELGYEVTEGDEEIGLIAQHVQSKIPIAASINKAGAKLGDKDGFDYLTIKFDKITPFITEAVNIHEEDIAELKDVIFSQTKDISTLQQEVETLKKLVAKLLD